jgi:fermentation-respiration switch protein FrsA (DUF1100 family)
MLDHPLLTERYFFPRPDRPRQHAWPVTTPDGNTLVCLRVDGGHQHTVVLFTGNGEVPGDYWPSPAREFSDRGVNLVVVGYRGYGGSSGTPQLAAMLSDVETVFVALEQPADRLVAFGRSLGSLYACELVARHPQVRGLILESGIHDPLERVLLRAHPAELGGSAEELAAEVDRRFNQRRKISEYPGPSLVLHTVRDNLVGVRHARDNHAAARNGKLVLFERGDHNSIQSVNYDEYWKQVGQFLHGALKAP